MPFGPGRKKEGNRGTRAQGDYHAPGWDALDRVFEVQFPGQDPLHWSPSDESLPAQDGVSGISAYRDGDAWFYVTYGLTDLFESFSPPEAGADGDGTRWSGFGFELTMRVLSPGAEPPLWPVNLLEKLGKYVYQTKAGFEHGHRLDPGGPITGDDPPTRLTALAFAIDPVLEPIEAPSGLVEFITAVGITADELARMKDTTTDAVLSELRIDSPRLVTDPGR
jgi:hypothetical protein